MGTWHEAPKTRVYEISMQEASEYRLVDENGAEMPLFGGREPYRVIRPDGKIFKPASWRPTAGAFSPVYYLEEP